MPVLELQYHSLDLLVGTAAQPSRGRHQAEGRQGQGRIQPHPQGQQGRCGRHRQQQARGHHPETAPQPWHPFAGDDANREGEQQQPAIHRGRRGLDSQGLAALQRQQGGKPVGVNFDAGDLEALIARPTPAEGHRETVLAGGGHHADQHDAAAQLLDLLRA